MCVRGRKDQILVARGETRNPAHQAGYDEALGRQHMSRGAKLRKGGSGVPRGSMALAASQGSQHHSHHPPHTMGRHGGHGNGVPAGKEL
jgi:hypothetical protein